MAEKINIIVTEEALKGLEDAIKKVEQLQKFINDAGSPSGNKAYTDSLRQQALETKTLTDAVIKNERAEQARQNTKIKNNALEKSNLALQNAQQNAIDKNLKAEQKATQNEVAEVRKRLLLIASLHKQQYTQEEAQRLAHDKALLFSKEQELKQIRAVISMRQSLNAQRQKEIDDADKLAQAQAKIDAKNSRTGASSSIPSMGSKIADLKATEKLSHAYVQLTANREKAKQKLQDYIAEETRSTAEIRKAQKEFDVLNKKVAAADKAVGRFSDENRKINGFAQSIGNLMGAFGISTGLYLGVDIVKNIYQTTKQLQSLDLALKMVSGTQEEFAINQGFLRSLAEQYGIEIKGLTKNFTEFWVASKGKLEAEQIKGIFTSISKSVAVMGLSVEQQDSAFLALQQMMSKGTVQAEELKKQLGNALPGAVKAATMAYQALHPEMKITEKYFMEQMKAGKVLSAELLPELAKAYEKLYGIENVKRAETLQAAQERLANSWTDAVRRMTGGNSVFTSLVSSFTNSLKWWLDNAENVFKYTSMLGFSISKIYEIINKGEIDIENHKKNKDNAVKQAKADIAELSKGEQKLTLQLSIKNKELERYIALRKTAKGDNEIKKIDEYIKKSKEEIDILNNKLTIEGKIIKTKKDVRKKDTLEKANALERESNLLELEKIELQEKLNKVKGIVSGSGAEAREKLAKEKEIEIQIKKNKSAITKNNVLATYYNAILDETIDKTKKVATPTGGTKVETEAERKAREKADKDRTKSLEDSLKLEYDLKMSNLEVQKQLAQEEIDLANAITQNKEIQYNDVIEATKYYNGVLIAIEKAKYDEELRLAGENSKEKKIAYNKWFISTLKLSKEMAESLLKVTKDFSKDGNEVAKKMLSDIEENAKKFEEIDKRMKEGKEDRDKEALKAQEDAFKMFAGDFADKLGFSDAFDLLLKGKEGETLFDRLKKDEATWKDYGLAITTIMQDAYNFINQQSQARFDAEYNRLEEQKNIGLKNAGDSASAKEKIELDYEKKKKEIQKREAKAKKQQSLMNIALDTAQAVMSVLSTGGGTRYADFGISAGLLSGMVIAMGAAQAAMVIAQKIPEYWQGTDNAKEGLALTQERGAEIITDRKGKIKTFGSHKGAVLTRMQSGDKVFNAEESKRMMFENEYRLKATTTNTNNGMTADEMRGIMVDTLGGRPTLNMNFDKGGFGSYISKNGNITRQSESRGSGRGIEV